MTSTETSGQEAGGIQEVQGRGGEEGVSQALEAGAILLLLLVPSSSICFFPTRFPLCISRLLPDLMQVANDAKVVKKGPASK